MIRLVVIALLLVGLSACQGGPQVVAMSEVIEMRKAGTTDATLLEWVNDPARTFDLSDTDVMTLVESGVSQKVINAMLAKSEEHHEKAGHSEKHQHQH